MACACSWCHDQLDVRVYNVPPSDGAEAVCPEPNQLFVTVPVREGDLSEDLAIAFISQISSARLLGCSTAQLQA